MAEYKWFPCYNKYVIRFKGERWGYRKLESEAKEICFELNTKGYA